MSTFVPTNAPIPGLEIERAPRIQIGSLNEAGLIADLKRSGFDDFHVQPISSGRNSKF